jgi:hypothetical protein
VLLGFVNLIYLSHLAKRLKSWKLQNVNARNVGWRNEYGHGHGLIDFFWVRVLVQNEQSDTCLIFKVRCNLHGRIVESMPCLERLCVKTSLQNG